MYREAHPWDPPKRVFYLNQLYVWRENLRYGYNPHQGSALYEPTSDRAEFDTWVEQMKRDFDTLPVIKPVVGNYKLLKTGKQGLSQTNLEDVDRSVRTVAYFLGRPACAIPKHLNPAGVAIGSSPQKAFERAWDCDSRSAYGSVPTFNCAVDKDTANALMEKPFVEGVAAPEFEEGVVGIFETYTSPSGKRKSPDIRVIQIENLDSIPLYVGDDTHGLLEPTLLIDGRLILQELYVSQLTPENFREACEVVTDRQPTEQEWRDMEFAWRVLPNVRSNGVDVVRDEYAVCIGTGQQERIGAIEDAIQKAVKKGHEMELPGAVFGSDGFMLKDNIGPLSEVGITAIIQPGGGKSDQSLIDEANKKEMAMILTGERVFAHF